VIEDLELRPYRLTLKRVWETARGKLHLRTGWLLCVHSGGLRGYGDCAPLPKAGTEGREQAFAALADWRTHLIGASLETALERIGADRTPAPAARFAVECALLDLAARRAGMPLRRWLSPSASDSVEVNATLGPLRDVTGRIVRASCRSGFRVLKLKVGLESPAQELRRLSGLARDLTPGVALRLDANRAWTLEEAAGMVDGLNGLPIDSLEEPLRDPVVKALQRLQQAAAFSLALDETLHDPSCKIELTRLPVRRIVLKPAVVGSLLESHRIAIQAAEIGVETVLTSLLETTAGIWPTLQLAAAIPSPLAHGLDTSGWLAENLEDPPVAIRGRIPLPEQPGSGFRPNNPELRNE
jgi:o-succinylbenzoate synthase